MTLPGRRLLHKTTKNSSPLSNETSQNPQPQKRTKNRPPVHLGYPSNPTRKSENMSQIADSAHLEGTHTPSLPWIEKLISFDTVSRNPNLGLIETVRDELRCAGVEATITTEPRGQWANLFATIPAHDGETNGGIVLSGHTDVVPVDGQDLAERPLLKPEVRDGLLYGRRVCDMKGFIGAGLSLLPKMQKEHANAAIEISQLASAP